VKMFSRKEIGMIRRGYDFLGSIVLEDGTLLVNFHCDLTLRCNERCPDCLKMLGVLPINNEATDLSEEHIREAGRLLKKYKMRIRRLRISGGEPLLHPEFSVRFQLIREAWNPAVIRVFTNDTLALPWGKKYIGSILRPISMDLKKIRHVPYYASPFDLGISPESGFSSACAMSSSCGRSFNSFGFTPCMQYPHIGRILGKDVHSSHPKILGDVEICKHCICTLPRRKRWEVQLGIKNKTIEYPTKTYREGIAREKEQPTKMVDFLERL